METNTKNLLDALTLDELKKYLDTRQGIVFYKIITIDNFLDELNLKYTNTTKEQWEQACLEDGIQSFSNLAYDFYDTFDENSYDPDLFEMTWQDMVEDEIEGAIKTLKRQSKLEQLIN
jgi:hypothetical protein